MNKILDRQNQSNQVETDPIPLANQDLLIFTSGLISLSISLAENVNYPCSNSTSLLRSVSDLSNLSAILGESINFEEPFSLSNLSGPALAAIRIFLFHQLSSYPTLKPVALLLNGYATASVCLRAYAEISKAFQLSKDSSGEFNTNILRNTCVHVFNSCYSAYRFSSTLSYFFDSTQGSSPQTTHETTAEFAEEVNPSILEQTGLASDSTFVEKLQTIQEPRALRSLESLSQNVSSPIETNEFSIKAPSQAPTPASRQNIPFRSDTGSKTEQSLPVPPTYAPTAAPTGQPSNQPSQHPFAYPSSRPSTQPTSLPSGQPLAIPSRQPSAVPSRQPTSKPTFQPSIIPSSKPSAQPIQKPSATPSVQPSAKPSLQPSRQPSQQPSTQPTTFPSIQPSSQPSTQPSVQPSNRPSQQPSAQPTTFPSIQPSSQPSTQPSLQPSRQPSQQPSVQPSNRPSQQPSNRPSPQPSNSPSEQPSTQPTTFPSIQPSSQPSTQPSLQPSNRPSQQPSTQPTSMPSLQPSSQPSTQPSLQPSNRPSQQPSTQPTIFPSIQPSNQPSAQPSAQPSSRPSIQPSMQPSNRPSSQPSIQPTTFPSIQPSRQPSTQPSLQPSNRPSSQPSIQPTTFPSIQPSRQPSTQPSLQPSNKPSTQPSAQPTTFPSIHPSSQPSVQPSAYPTIQPSSNPSISPSKQPNGQPSLQPTAGPSGQPLAQPSLQPSSVPSTQPSNQPSALPTSQPSLHPTMQPSAQPSAQPSLRPTTIPSNQPQAQPSLQPSSDPSIKPSMQPSDQPHSNPTSQPTTTPTNQPSNAPTTFLSTQAATSSKSQGGIVGAIAGGVVALFAALITAYLRKRATTPSENTSRIAPLDLEQNAQAEVISPSEPASSAAEEPVSVSQRILQRARESFAKLPFLPRKASDTIYPIAEKDLELGSDAELEDIYSVRSLEIQNSTSLAEENEDERYIGSPQNLQEEDDNDHQTDIEWNHITNPPQEEIFLQKETSSNSLNAPSGEKTPTSFVSASKIEQQEALEAEAKSRVQDDVSSENRFRLSRQSAQKLMTVEDLEDPISQKATSTNSIQESQLSFGKVLAGLDFNDTDFTNLDSEIFIHSSRTSKISSPKRSSQGWFSESEPEDSSSANRLFNFLPLRDEKENSEEGSTRPATPLDSAKSSESRGLSDEDHYQGDDIEAHEITDQEIADYLEV